MKKNEFTVEIMQKVCNGIIKSKGNEKLKQNTEKNMTKYGQAWWYMFLILYPGGRDR